MSNLQQTLDQRRAKHAWKAVQHVIDLHKKTEPAKQFGRAAKKLPARIMAAGLGQSLAFLLSKGKTPLLLIALGDWVLIKRSDPSGVETPVKLGDSAAQQRLIQAVLNGTTTDLRRHTAEALAYLQWLNRFADAEKITDGEDKS